MIAKRLLKLAVVFLFAGVNTSDILSAYIQTVYSLRLLDPSGVLMENVCQPVRQYLR